MDYRITADERAGFKRCRRQWDFASANRRDLEPVTPGSGGLTGAIKDALAIYYYPGTWDWSPEIVLPLVHQAFLRSLEQPADTADAIAGSALLEAYCAWAPTLDDFAPIKIDHDVDALVPDVREPDRGLLAPDGRRVIYAGRVDLLAVDATDAYWVVRHRVVTDWLDTHLLDLDEEAVASCWAWEQAYLGMRIAGTIHNEVRTGDPKLPRPKARRWGRRYASTSRAAAGDPFRSTAGSTLSPLWMFQCPEWSRASRDRSAAPGSGAAAARSPAPAG